MEHVRIASYDFSEVPYVLYFDDYDEFMKLAKQNNHTIFELRHEEGILKKKQVKYLLFIVSEFLICVYSEELKNEYNRPHNSSCFPFHMFNPLHTIYISHDGRTWYLSF